MQDDACVCCGTYVPEGRQVCHKCAGEDEQTQISKDEEEMLLWLSKASEKEIYRPVQTNKFIRRPLRRKP